MANLNPGISFSGNWAFLLPRVKPRAWHAHAGRLLMASCLWLCHRMTDSPEFSNPDQALSSGGSHLVMLAPGSEVLPGQVSSSLFGGLKARGGSVRDLHLHLHAAGPATVAAVVCPRSPCVPPFIHLCFQALPKGSLPAVRFAKAPGRNNAVRGGSVRWS